MKIINWLKTRLNWEVTLITVFLLIYSLAAISVSLNRYWQYNAFWYDFGIFDETIWKLSHFSLPYITHLAPPLGKIVWGDHFNPSLIILTPLYWITSKQEIIFIAQVISVVTSAGIAYLITRKFIHTAWVRLALITSYLGFVGLQNALFTDVHNIVFALLPLMLTIWAMFNCKNKLYWLCLLLTLGCQENMAGLGIALGLYLIFKKDRKLKIGSITIIISLIYAVVTTRFIMPFFNHLPYTYQPNIPQYWYQWITNFFIPVDTKLKTEIVTSLSFGILPIFYPPTWPLIIEHFLERFVLNVAGTRWDLGMHYNATLSPIMFLGTLEMVIMLQKTRWQKYLKFWAITTILIVIYIHRFYYHGPLMLSTMPAFYQQTQNAKFLDKFVNSIPKKGLLMTQNNLAAHFTHDQTMLLNENYSLYLPDTIAIDIRSGQNGNNFFPLSEDKVKNLITKLESDKNYQKESITDVQLIFHKN